ncbi:MAG: RagB/SusD family nutrient uptake outer membrane protein, partial [Paramuribaculum sp.]|nr:RagB/SusD family nutrient uptake outer membrane protein [Paramuribaculum sp.]
MNKYIASLLIGTSMVVGFTSCEDYLDRAPEANLVAENYFINGTNLSAYVMNYYGMFPSHSDNAYGMGTFANDNGTDNQVARSIPSRYAQGQWRTSNDESNWSFGNIRSLNFFFENVMANLESGKLDNTALVRQSIGEAYFFRAYQYFASYSAVGDYPIIDNVLPDEKEVLLENSYRRPRNQVARHILEDLDNALAYLPDISDKGKQGINRDCALLLRSRVALFEGTWLKYHKGTALVPGGPGWPGDASLLGSFDIDSEINYFLTEAMNSAKELGDKFVGRLTENTGVIDAFSPTLNPLNPYYCMFGQQNLDAYNEVLMYRAYQLESPAVSTQIQHSFMTHGGGLGYTRGMIRSFV